MDSTMDSSSSTTLESLVNSFEGILKGLTAEHGSEKSFHLADKALSLITEIPKLNYDNRNHRTAALQMHTTAINLWNLAVGMRTSGASSLHLNAQLRHVACNLIVLTGPPNNSESNYRKQLTMALKTGRAWLDCDTPSMADTSLTLARSCYDNLANILGEKAQSLEMVKQLFKITSFQAEAAVGMQQGDKAGALVREAKGLVMNRLERETGHLSMVCYNFGLDMFQKGSYEESVGWLKESYELGQGCPEVGAKKQSRTLRLMANAYLEWNCDLYWQKALNAVGLANSEHSHPTGFHLKCYILLKHDPYDSRLQSSLDDTLRHLDLAPELALATVQLFSKHKRVDLALKGLRVLASRFRSSSDLGRFQLLHLEILLEEKRLEEAKDILESVVLEQSSGQPLDINTRKGFHLTLWEQAAGALDRDQYREALVWYNFSHSLFTDVEADCKNLAKLQRNRCNCYIMMEEHEKANIALSDALKKDGDNPYTQFVAFKLAMAQNDEEKALEAVANLSSCLTKDGSDEEDTKGLICLAAQNAFEKSSPVVASKTLEHLVDLSQNTQQVLTALRCLTRLRLTFLSKEGADKDLHISAIQHYTEKALSRLAGADRTGTDLLSQDDEAAWFMKVAWNLALQCHKSPLMMRKLFKLCSTLLELCRGDPGNKGRKHTCLLMSAAACLQAARDSTENQEKVELLRETLELVDQTRAVAMAISGGNGEESQASVLLLLYEFEAKILLGESGLEGIFSKLSKLKQLEPKTFEIIAALSMNSKASELYLAEEALRRAIECHISQEKLDYCQISKCYHSLVQLHMDSDSHHDVARLEKAWLALQEALKTINVAPKDEYPEIEVLWLLTKAWNCGVRFFSMGRNKEAEQWCSLSMKYMEHLSSFKESYQHQMSSIYSEILDKLNTEQAVVLV